MKRSGLTPTRLMARHPGRTMTRAMKDGRVIVTKWPRARGKGGTPAQLAARFEWGWIGAMTKYRLAIEQDAAQEWSQNTVYLPRDLLSKATYGVLYEITLKDGTRLWGERLLTKEVQALLDQITQENGAMIMRTPDGWVGLSPGAAGKVLTANGPAQVPSWQPGGGGTGPTVALDVSGTRFAIQPFIADWSTAVSLTPPGGNLFGDDANGIVFSATDQTGGRGMGIFQPMLTGDWTATALIQVSGSLENFHSFGVGFTNTTAHTTDLWGITGQRPTDNYRMAEFGATGAPSGLTAYQDYTHAVNDKYPDPRDPLWIKLTRRSNALTFQYSTDGETWSTLFTSVYNAHVAAPTHFCVAILFQQPLTIVQDIACHLLSWKVTYP